MAVCEPNPLHRGPSLGGGGEGCVQVEVKVWCYMVWWHHPQMENNVKRALSTQKHQN